ncbi:MAG: hypothetical protein SF066_23535 [Thermoanaerobaculia bacterium]|nr:hypothetical protein [Thermoanaerobaculia bacterium]
MEWKQLVPMALVALVITLLPLRDTTAVAPPTSPLTVGSSPPENSPSPANTASAPTAGSIHVFELLGEFTGQLEDAKNHDGPLLLPPGTRFEHLIVTLPDPLDTTLALDFDLALDGLQRGLATEGYLLDRFWLPWHSDKKNNASKHRTEPGVLLYRWAARNELPRLRIVFLVGETPRQGIHAAAFHLAIDTIRRIEQRAGANRTPLAILGPYFSGTAESLARALAHKKEQGAQIITGSATAADLEEPFERFGTAASFDRTVPEDRVLVDAALCALQRRLALKSRRSVALLVEADTAYGASLRTPQGQGCDLEPVFVRFSGRLSSLREALGERVKNGPAPASSQANELELKRKPKTELELDLTSPGRAVDVLGELSPDTVDLDDLALANLIRQLATDGFQVVGLLSTDPMDKVYLGRRLRTLAPDLQLLTFTNSLLYAHPQASVALEGTLVVTSAPLIPEGSGTNRQHLAGETQSGILRAVRALVGPPEKRAERLVEGRRHGWIVAAGGGAFWPILTVPLDPKAGATASLPGPDGVALRGRVILALGFFLACLGFAAAWAHRTAPPRESEPTETNIPVGGGPAWQGRWLLAGALSLLALAAWVALVVGLLASKEIASGDFPLGLALVLLAAMYTLSCAFGLRIAARFRRGEGHPLAERALPGGERQWIPVGLVILPLVGWLLVEGWTGGQINRQFFYQRAVTFTGGLSPLVSLLFVALALFGWFLLQLKRLRATARHALAFPRPGLLSSEAELRAAADAADQRVGPLLSGAFPPASHRRFWSALAVLVLLAVVVAGYDFAIKPVAESAAYGWYFLCLVLLLLALGAISWYRFVALWREIQRLLVRVPPALLTALHHDGTDADKKRVQDLVDSLDWNPMRSFAFSMPKFRMAQLAATEAERQLAADPRGDEVRAERLIMMEAESAHDLERETKARQKLQRLFQQFEADGTSRDWAEFRAFRFVGYLRFVFEILRLQLLTTVWLGLTALATVSFYDYHPRSLLTLSVTAALLGLAATVLKVFLEMETNPMLSTVAGVKATEVKSWTQLIFNLLSYVMVPLLALLASRIPVLGQLLKQVSNPLFQGFGGP